MEALRIVKKIESTLLQELDKFKGQKVEIIILPYGVDKIQKKSIADETKEVHTIMSLRGTLKTKIDGMEFQNNIRKEWNR